MDSKERWLPVSTKKPTADKKPDKNELKGNEPTSNMYKNCRHIIVPFSTASHN